MTQILHDPRRCRYCRKASRWTRRAWWLLFLIAAVICALAAWGFMDRWARG